MTGGLDFGACDRERQSRRLRLFYGMGGGTVDRVAAVVTRCVVLFPRVATVLVFASAMVACNGAYEEGEKLGLEHVDLVVRDDLTYERMMQDLAARSSKYDDPDDRAEFRKGYKEAVRPVEERIAAIVVAHASKEAGTAISDALGDVGEGFGRMLRGFSRAIEGSKGKVVRPGPEEKERIKEAGRGVGAFMRAMGDRAESFFEGVDEEFKRTDSGVEASESSEWNSPSQGRRP